eukprot:gene27672-16935_t
MCAAPSAPSSCAGDGDWCAAVAAGSGAEGCRAVGLEVAGEIRVLLRGYMCHIGMCICRRSVECHPRQPEAGEAVVAAAAEGGAFVLRVAAARSAQEWDLWRRVAAFAGGEVERGVAVRVAFDGAGPTRGRGVMGKAGATMVAKGMTALNAKGGSPHVSFHCHFNANH